MALLPMIPAAIDFAIKDTISVEITRWVAGMMRTAALVCTVGEMWPSPTVLILMSVIH
jgi:hypothetical protein